MKKRVLTLLVTALLATSVLTACGSANGKIKEIEEGRNGVKAEVVDGNGDYEVYLIPSTTCEQNDYLRDCADEDDFLVAPRGARPGVNR